MRWIKREFKWMLITLAAFTPLIVYMDVFMNLQIGRDHGFWILCGFISCVIFYAEITKNYRDKN